MERVVVVLREVIELLVLLKSGEFWALVSVELATSLVLNDMA
jgi:hypothetical protein